MTEKIDAFRKKRGVFCRRNPKKRKIEKFFPQNIRGFQGKKAILAF